MAPTGALGVTISVRLSVHQQSVSSQSAVSQHTESESTQEALTEHSESTEKALLEHLESTKSTKIRVNTVGHGSIFRADKSEI